MSSPDHALHFGDTTIDLAGRRLWRAGEEQPLEPKAFGMLALLVGDPGRVFTRDEILDAVWGHRHVTPGVLNRIVTLLRHALGEDAHHPRLLHTLHGVGYRFDMPVIAGPSTTEPAGAAAEVHADANAAARRRTAPAVFWYAVLLVAAGAIGAAWWWSTRSTANAAHLDPAPPKAAAAAAPPTLVVMPLKPIGEGDSVRIIAVGLG